MQITALGEGHQTLSQGAQALGPGLSRLDTAVRKQRGRQVRQHEALVCGSATEAGSLSGLWHCCVLFRESVQGGGDSPP